jgi:hypothetical protein
MVMFVSKRLVYTAALLLVGMAQEAGAQDLCVVEDCQVETDYVSQQYLSSFFTPSTHLSCR